MAEDDEILAILMSPVPEAEGDGALAAFKDGFGDGWHGRPKKRSRSEIGIYHRAYENGKKARAESDSF